MHPSALRRPFRGSRAVAAGLLTARELRGPRFVRLFPDVHAPAGAQRDLLLRSEAAAVLVEGSGVLAGYSAAELWEASCGAADAPAEVLVLPGFQRRSRDGLVVRRDALLPEEVTRHRGCAVTTPVRTAFDLGRWAPSTVERVVAVDALARRRFPLDAVRSLAARHVSSPGRALLPAVLRLADPLADSPMETRIRVALVLGGLPAPVSQHRVPRGRSHVLLDLAYPHLLLAVEYDGRHHRGQVRARLDLEREAFLVRSGWTVLRYDADTVLHRPGRIVADVRAAIRART